jgi:eukaryotic translation initiation factor 2C
VSYAPPAYYADRLCDRLRVYFREFFVPASSSGAPSDGRRQQQQPRGSSSRAAAIAAAATWRGGNAGPEAQKRAGDEDFGAAWKRFAGPGRKDPWHEGLDDSMFWM